MKGIFQVAYGFILISIVLWFMIASSFTEFLFWRRLQYQKNEEEAPEVEEMAERNQGEALAWKRILNILFVSTFFLETAAGGIAC